MSDSVSDPPFLVLPPGRLAWSGTLAVAVLLCALSVVLRAPGTLAFWPLACSAVVIAIIALVCLAPPWEPLRLTHAGISYATVLGRTESPWANFGGFGLAHVGALQFVCFTYAPRADQSGNAARARFGRFDWMLPSHYGMSADGLARTLEHSRARFAPAPTADSDARS
jgi:hypothetical protein